MDGPDPEITIDSMFAANPEIGERLRANRARDAELSRNLLGDPAIDGEVSRFLCESPGYDPPIVYRQG